MRLFNPRENKEMRQPLILDTCSFILYVSQHLPFHTQSVTYTHSIFIVFIFISQYYYSSRYVIIITMMISINYYLFCHSIFSFCLSFLKYFNVARRSSKDSLTFLAQAQKKNSCSVNALESYFDFLQISAQDVKILLANDIPLLLVT